MATTRDIATGEFLSLEQMMREFNKSYLVKGARLRKAPQRLKSATRTITLKTAKRAHMRFNPVPIDKSILSVAEYSREGYNKIRTIVTRANSRIMRLENKANFSPALKQVALGTRNGRFILNKSMSWEEMKRVYSQSLEFLNSPTSTVYNANIYLNSLGRDLNLNREHTRILLDKLNSVYITDKGYVGDGDSLTIREQLLQLHDAMPIEYMRTERSRFEYYNNMLRDILNETNSEVADIARQQTVENLRKAFYGF